LQLRDQSQTLKRSLSDILLEKSLQAMNMYADTLMVICRASEDLF
jgi:hypothetical protein